MPRRRRALPRRPVGCRLLHLPHPSLCTHPASILLPPLLPLHLPNSPMSHKTGHSERTRLPHRCLEVWAAPASLPARCINDRAISVRSICCASSICSCDSKRPFALSAIWHQSDQSTSIIGESTATATETFPAPLSSQLSAHLSSTSYQPSTHSFSQPSHPSHELSC